MDAASASKKGELTRLAAKLDALSPLKVLARGYAIAMDGDGLALRDAREAAVGDRIRLRLHTGSLDCRVEDVHGT